MWIQDSVKPRNRCLPWASVVVRVAPVRRAAASENLPWGLVTRGAVPAKAAA